MRCLIPQFRLVFRLFHPSRLETINFSRSPPLPSHHTQIYMPFKKFASLIPFRRSLLIAPLSPCLALSASSAPVEVPFSFAGKSIVCLVIGILGAGACPIASSLASSFLWRLAAFRRSFFDFEKASTSVPSAPSTPSAFSLSRHFHSHSGYSSSDNATGSSLPLI